MTPFSLAPPPHLPSGALSEPSGLPLLPPLLLDSPVLIVEDEVMIAWMIESLLEDMGFSSVTIASSGEDAVEAAQRLEPALVVSDINLGNRGMDGISAVKQIIREAGDPYILFVTAHAGPSEVGRIASDVPGALILRKPVEQAELRKAVMRLAEQFRRY